MWEGAGEDGELRPQHVHWGPVVCDSRAVFGVNSLHEAVVLASGELKGGLDPCRLLGLRLWVEAALAAVSLRLPLLSRLSLPFDSPRAGVAALCLVCSPCLSVLVVTWTLGPDCLGDTPALLHPVCDPLWPLNFRLPQVLQL